MPPRGNEGLDITPILTHYLFLFTSILAVISWFIAFISQCVAEASIRGHPVGVLWFGIFLQLFLILGVLYTLASDSIAMNRFQISTFGAIAIVFAVQGVNEGIFSGVPSLDAMSAGWLILAIVDILWVLYFTSEEDSLSLHIFNSMGTGGLTPPSRRRRATRTQSVNMGGNGYSNNYGGGIENNYDVKGGMGARMGVGIGNQGLRSQNSIGARSYDAGGAARSMGGGGAGSVNNVTAGSIGAGGATNEPASPIMSGNAGLGAGANNTMSGSNSPTNPRDTINSEAPDSYTYKAKAMYAYTASPDDPNEISFTKGEILDIVDKQGKWWQARKADGTIGIAPSNYLQLI